MGNSEKESLANRTGYEIIVRREAQLETQDALRYYDEIVVKDSVKDDNKKSSDKLLEMARNARKEIVEGKSELMDFQKL